MANNAKWMDVQRRRWKVRDKATGKIVEREYPEWHGRMKVNGRWNWFKLFTDKRASQKRWDEIITKTEQRQAGVITPVMDHAARPIAEHIKEYTAALERQNVTKNHLRVVKYMLNRLVELGKWKGLADIHETSMTAILKVLEGEGKTVAYRNQYLTRVKAFVHWLMPERLLADPLRKMKRANQKRAKKRRARRPLEMWELLALLNTCPESRRLKYAFPTLSGLRRAELKDLRWGDLHLNAIIPFIQLREEQTKNGQADIIPLHPYLVQELNKLPQGMPGTKVFRYLPEGRTMLRDLTLAGVTQADALGRRADFHALRHTFRTNLDRTGCSRATALKLLRHDSDDVDDGYNHARMSEIYAAVCRLPSPLDAEKDQGVKTGTNDAPVARAASDDALARWSRTGHGAFPSCQTVSHPGSPVGGPLMSAIPLDIQGDSTLCLTSADVGLRDAATRDILSKTSPRSSVG